MNRKCSVAREQCAEPLSLKL